MFFTGELVIHDIKCTVLSYVLSENLIPHELLIANEPFQCELDYLLWRVKRRIGAVGLLWNKPSDAWLGIYNLKSAQRNEIFKRLLESGEITSVCVEGVETKFYCLTDEVTLLESSKSIAKKRCELIAPLDNLMWDRKLIKALFNFDYTWEIYHPVAKRKYGYYVLPLIYGDGFVGRVEAVAERKTRLLKVKNIWYEEGIKQTRSLDKAVNDCLKRFAKFNDCDEIIWS